MFYVHHFSSVAQSCLTLCDPTNGSTPGLPVHHQLSRVHPDLCPLSQWCHPTISSSVIPFSCLQSFPASGSFPVSQLFTSGGQSIGVSASTSVLPMNTQDWFPLGWTGWTPQFKSINSQCSTFFTVQLPHPYMTTGKTIALTRRTFVDKVTSLLFNMLSRLVISFLPRSKHVLISWLQSPSAVILEPPKIKSATVSPSICHEVIGPDAMILVFWILSFKPMFHSPFSLSSRGSLILHFLPLFIYMVLLNPHNPTEGFLFYW